MKSGMKIVICVFAVVGSYIYVHSQTPKQPIQSICENGRYQVVAIQVNTDHKTAMKIDTQTGRTWELVEVDHGQNAPDLEWLEESRELK